MNWMYRVATILFIVSVFELASAEQKVIAQWSFDTLINTIFPDNSDNGHNISVIGTGVGIICANLKLI
jgi:hypothetical protein